MKKNTVRRGLFGHIALWVFRAYCLFFVIEIFRFYEGVKDIHLPVGNEMEGGAGIIAGGMIVFIPLLVIMGLLFWISRLTRVQSEKEKQSLASENLK